VRRSSHPQHGTWALQRSTSNVHGRCLGAASSTGADRPGDDQSPLFCDFGLAADSSVLRNSAACIGIDMRACLQRLTVCCAHTPEPAAASLSESAAPQQDRAGKDHRYELPPHCHALGSQTALAVTCPAVRHSAKETSTQAHRQSLVHTRRWCTLPMSGATSITCSP